VFTVAVNGEAGVDGMVMLAKVSRVPPSGACRGSNAVWAAQKWTGRKRSAERRSFVTFFTGDLPG